MPKKKNKQSVARTIFGVLFLVIGLVGLVLPILPGWIFLIFGAGLLGWPAVGKLFGNRS